MNFRDHHNCRRMFWKRGDGTSTACSEEEATHMEIETRRGAYRTSFEFEWPRDKLKAQDLAIMLDTAFDYGKAHAKAEVRSVLGL